MEPGRHLGIRDALRRSLSSSLHSSQRVDMTPVRLLGVGGLTRHQMHMPRLTALRRPRNEDTESLDAFTIPKTLTAIRRELRDV